MNSRSVMEKRKPVSKMNKRSSISLTKQLTDKPSLSEVLIEVKTAEKLSKLKPLELQLLIMIHEANGVTVNDLDNLKILGNIVFIITCLNNLHGSGYIHRSETLQYYGTSVGNYLLRSILPSFTFPLPRF